LASSTSCSCAGRNADAVVLDERRHKLVRAREHDADARRSRVLDHVRQRLLHDPVQRRGAGSTRTLRRRENGFERRLLDRRPSAGRGIVGGVHVAVLPVGDAAERFGLGQVADDRMAAALRHAPRLLVVADERRDVVSVDEQRADEIAPEQAGGAGDEDEAARVLRDEGTGRAHQTSTASAVQWAP
jgi:hypothetical protein